MNVEIKSVNMLDIVFPTSRQTGQQK